MQLSFAVLLLIGDSSARHHHHHSDRPVRPNKDISDKNIHPWVYRNVYDAVNPVPLPRTSNVPVLETHTPYGNPYWPYIKEEAPEAVVPTEVVPTEVAPTEVAPTKVAPTEVVPTEVAPTKVVPKSFA